MPRLTATRVLRLLAILVAVHGIVFAVASLTVARVDDAQLEALGEIYFFLLVAPALILAMPLSPLLWRWHLMQAPGGFAWPSPLGLALVYASWVLLLFALSLLAGRGRS